MNHIPPEHVVILHAADISFKTTLHTHAKAGL